MEEARAAYADVRRQQILGAAVACFCRSGFHKTTMQEIAQEVGLSPGALYRYFRSKEEIIEECGRGSRERNEAIFRMAGEEEGTLPALYRVIDTLFGLLDLPGAAEGLPLEIEMWAERQRNPRIAELLTEALDTVRVPLATIVREAQARGEIDGGLRPESVAQVMVSFAEGMVLQKVMDPGLDHWAYADVIKAMLSGSFWKAETR